MILEYQIEAEDLVNYQLFIASKSKRIKQRRQKNRLLVPVGYLFFGILFILQNKMQYAVVFIVIGLLWYFLYPLWERRRYIKHYQGHVLENFLAGLNKPV